MSLLHSGAMSKYDGPPESDTERRKREQARDGWSSSLKSDPDAVGNANAYREILQSGELARLPEMDDKSPPKPQTLTTKE